MLWTHAYVLLLALTPPPCEPGELYRFPRSIHVWVVDSCGDHSECSHRECPLIQQRLDWLELQRIVEPRRWEDWSEQIEEQEQLECTWAILADAWDSESTNGDIAHNLRRLRERIGEEAYIAGRMPNPVPLSRYSEFPR